MSAVIMIEHDGIVDIVATHAIESVKSFPISEHRVGVGHVMAWRVIIGGSRGPLAVISNLTEREAKQKVDELVAAINTVWA